MNRFKRAISAVAAAAMTAVSFPAAGISGVCAAEETVFPFTIEGEDMEGAKLWTSIYENKLPGYSGEGFFYLQGDSASIKVVVPEDDMYSITVHGAQILNKEGREQAIEVNGVKYKKTAAYSDKWIDYDYGVVRLKKGENTIKFISEYGYIAIDTVTVAKAEFPDLSVTAAVPCDPKATPEAKSLMNYLHSVYGKNILSGQQEIYGGGHGKQTTIRYDAEKDICVDQNGKTYSFSEDSKATADDGSKFVWTCYDDETGQAYNYNQQNRNYTYNDYEQEFNYLSELTGKLPAIRGFDFNCHNPGFAWEDGVTDRMISWAKDKNGICTASWHVTVPRKMSDFEVDEEGNITKISDDWQAYTYALETDWVTANCMVEGTKEYYFFKEAMRLLAEQIGKLQDAGVPIIFRPFHEAEGNPDAEGTGKGAWFWWSKEGTKVYNELWKYLYTTLTEEYGLHNIIWEQNLYAWADSSANWYTGDKWVDIVGFDKYNTEYNRHDGNTTGPNEDAESGIFWTLVNFVKNNKMVSMPENDSIPSLSNIKTEKAAWLYYCTWYDGDGAPQFISGDAYQNPDTLKELMTSDYCLTLDELPKDLYTSMGSSDIPTSSTTKPANVKYGDANCDENVNMADAVLVMQAIANGDEYGLGKENGITEIGSVNADVYQPGSGLTMSDAASIQAYVMEIIDTLPEE